MSYDNYLRTNTNITNGQLQKDVLFLIILINKPEKALQERGNERNRFAVMPKRKRSNN